MGLQKIILNIVLKIEVFFISFLRFTIIESLLYL